MGADAEVLILRSDIEGLYTADPHTDCNAKLIPAVYEMSGDVLAAAGGAGTKLGTGGMQTKLHAAEICMENGIDMIIADGSRPDLLYDIADGKQVGTRFYGRKQ